MFRMIRKATVFIMISLLLLTAVFAEDTVNVAQNDVPPTVTVYVDGEQLIFPDQTPIIVSGRTLVPMRAIFERLGASIYWDQGTRTVISTKGNTSVVIQIDNTLMIKDNEHYQLDVPASLVNNRTMVPLRAVSQALGYDVEWDGEKYRVDIKTQVTE